MRKNLTIATLAAAVAIATFAMRSPETSAQQQDAAKPQGPPPAPVEVAPASSADIASVQWVPGTVVARDDARIATEQAGRVVTIAEIGDRIAKGDVIAKLDDEALSLAVRENEAALKRLDSQLDYQNRQVERLTKLESQSSVSATALDEAKSQGEMMTHDRARAAVALEQSRRQLREATIRAPFGGIVAERATQPGEYVQPGATVVRLVNTERVEVRAQAPVSLIAKMKAGDPVTLKDGGRAELEEIRAVVPVGDAQSRQVEIRVAVTGEDWPIGAALEVALPLGDTAEVVAVPRDALILRGKETFVFKVGADNKAERVAVETGSAQGSLIEIKGAIAPGDQLVIRGAERLQPGQSLDIKNAPAPVAPAIARSAQ